MKSIAAAKLAPFSHRRSAFSWFLPADPIHRLILCCQIFGVAPINITPSRKSLALRRLTTTLHIAWSVLLVSVAAFCNYQQYYSFVRNRVPIARFLTCAEYALNVVNCTLIVIGVNYQRHWYTEYKRQIDEVDWRLQRTCNISVELPVHLRRFTVILLIIVGLQFLASYGLSKDNIGLLYGVGNYVVPHVMMLLAMGTYFCLIRTVRQRFDWITEALLDMDVVPPEAADAAGVVAGYLLVLEFAGAPVRPVKVVQRLSELRDVHYDLCRFAANINRSFGWLVIGMLVSAVFVTTAKSYLLYYYMSIAYTRWIAYVYCVGWFVVNLIRISSVLYENASMMTASIFQITASIMCYPLPLSIRILFWCSQLFGATPINLDIFTPLKPIRNSTGLYFIRLTNALHLLWTLSVGAALIGCMYWMYVVVTMYLDIINICLDMCEFLSSILNCTIAMLGSNLQRHKFSKFSRTLHDLDDRLASGFRLPDTVFDSLADRLSVLVRWQFGALIFLAVDTTVLIHMHTEFTGVPLLVGAGVYVLPNIILLLTMIQYNSLLFIVRTRIECIGNDLSAIAKQMNEVSYCQWRIIASLRSRIQFAKSIYRDLTVLEFEVHRAFGVLMVSTMVTSFLIITIELFEFYSFINHRFSITLLFHALDWLLLHFGKLFLTFYMCSMVGRAKSKVATALHQIRFRDEASSSGVVSTVTQFSLQMLHEDRHQTACGILKLDLTLIGSIVSSLTTYLVILIQFDSSSKIITGSCAVEVLTNTTRS